MKKTSSDSSRSFRFLCPKSKIPAVAELLKAEGFRFSPEPFSEFCARLEGCPIPPGSSLAAIFGYIYIQDRSSMLPPLALNPAKGSAVLDMCASPGGKSGFLAQLTGNEGFVLANEPAKPRLATLRANLRRASLIQAATCSYGGEKLPLAPSSWKYILLDPPCSGWGTVKKHPKVEKIWSGAKTLRLENIQRALLRKAADLLEPGGFLLYSTCTTNYAENEAQTIFAEAQLGLKRASLRPFPGFVYAERPHGEGTLLVDGEACASQGFYLSLLRKAGAAYSSPPRKDQFGNFSFLERNFLESPIFDPELLPEGKIAVFNGKARFLPEQSLSLPEDFIWQGMPLGTLSGTRFLPDPCLRVTIPESSAAAVVFEDIKPVRDLLSGRDIRGPEGFSHIALWWRNLPLCVTSIKNGRILAPFKF